MNKAAILSDTRYDRNTEEPRMWTCKVEEN